MTNPDPSLQSILTLLPEIILVGMATWIYLGAAFSRVPANWTYSAVLGLAVAAMVLARQLTTMTEPQIAGVGVAAASGPVALDMLSFLMRAVAVISGLLLALTASFGGGQRLSGEFLGSLLMATAGVMLACASVDLVLLFVALELISIPTYVLLFLSRNDEGSAEATAKYFFLSILASAIMLYGFTLLYGISGSTMLPDVIAAIGAMKGTMPVMAIVAMVLVFGGLAYKIAAVPFHFYAPDVYQGTSNAAAGLLAVLPKIAGIAFLARLATASIPGVAGYGWHLVVIIAALTMTLGNFAALWQNNIRRLFAYSSIAHSGYLLIGLAGAMALAEGGGSRAGGLAAMMFYLIVYVLGTIAAFAALAWLGSRDREVNKVDELSGLIKTHPLTAAIIAVSMFSLTGIPPLGGFWGKLTLFSVGLRAAWATADDVEQTWLVALAVIAALNAAVSAGYYLRIVGVMFFGSSDSRLPAAGPRGALVSAAVCTVGLIAVGVFPGWLMQSSYRAAKGAITTTAEYHPYQTAEPDVAQLGNLPAIPPTGR